MIEIFRPDVYSKSIFDVNYKKLKEKGIKCILLDLDNTIAPVNIEKPDNKMKKFLYELKEKGFHLIIMSNSQKKRVEPFKNELELEDSIYRAYGILTNCRKISYEEIRDLLSIIKLGTDLGILKELTDLKVQKLYLYTKPANLQKYLGRQYEAIERNVKRAEVIKQIIAER